MSAHAILAFVICEILGAVLFLVWETLKKSEPWTIPTLGRSFPDLRKAGIVIEQSPGTGLLVTALSLVAMGFIILIVIFLS